MSEVKKNHVWEELDYKHDAIIEASAGTGKTYALEHIVEHLVKDGVDIRNVLLVTFTEKAAGELKERIRKILVDSKVDACTSAVRHLDETTICTIHAFCQELLREYPFESGMQMASDVINSDELLITKAVQTVITSSEFKGKYGKKGEQGHGGTPFSEKMIEWDSDKDTDGLLKKVIEILTKVVASGLDYENWKHARFVELKDLIKVMPGDGRPGQYVLSHTNNGAAIGRAQDNPRYKAYFDVMDNLLDKAVSQNLSLSERINAIFQIAQGKIDFVLRCWDGRKLPAGSKFREQEWLLTYGSLHDLCSSILKTCGENICTETVALAYKEYLRLKKRSRTMTFDDMVLEVSRMVQDAVSDVGNAAKQAFLKTLRMRYRIVLVDEFQDTDDKQWTIFRSLFSSKVGEIEGASLKQGCLIVVGDPKQAIYGFRGADIGTYLKAREEIKETRSEFPENQKVFRLDEMYRSTSQMVAAFDKIFRGSEWFKNMQANGLPIEYDEVKFPETHDTPKVEELRDFPYPQEESPVELLESAPAGAPCAQVRNKTVCLPLYLENMAEEMKRLHSDNKFWMNQKDARMDWSSMCVLVNSHADGDVVQKVLRAKRIPCRKFKEAWLFASVESESVLALFDYLSMPRKSGNLAALLLTPFFGVPLSKIEKRLENGDARFDDLCDRWRTYISKCEWVKFFESAMNDTDLGKPHVEDADFVRHRAGIRQIFDQLLTRCGRARDLSAFSDALRLWRRDDNALGENGSIRNKESEADAVQIMTMHVAKGLEFNAVFLPYGFTQAVRSDTPKEEKPAKEMESRRLLYVALTRAKYKLYLPWSRRANDVDFWRPGRGATALSTFLGQGILALYADAKDRVKGIDKLPEKQDKAEENRQPVDLHQNGDCPELPPRLGMKSRRFKWDSFSSLNHHSAKKVEEVEGAKPKDDEKQDAPDKQEEQKQKSLVPKGALSGTVFHEVMEKLCEASDGLGFEIGQKNKDEFKELITEKDDKKSPLLELVRRRLAANGVVNQVRKEDGETTASAIARMAWNALRTELDFGDGNKFKLSEIPLEKRKAEVNFVLDESLLGGVRGEGEGALNGSIDLLVRRDDGYYIVDWKTNALDDYGDETVKAAMKEAGYDLQYKIYTLAAEKWLGENTVKGIAYLFVRGGETGTNASGRFVLPMLDDERTKLVGEFAKKVADSDKNDAENDEEVL